MARIRSVKPEFFKHEELQDLEIEHPGQYVMLVYAGLWTQCDKNGVFRYKTRVVKNEILPYIDFDMQKTLDILEGNGFFIRFQHESRDYGYIPKFGKYQFPTKGEKDSPAKYPMPPVDIVNRTGQSPSAIQDTPEHDSQQPCDPPKEVSNNVPEDVPEAEGIWNTESGYTDSGITDSGAAAPNKCDFSDDPQSLFIYIWQHTPDIFNAFGRIELPNEWSHFWATAPPTCEEVRTVMQNVIDDVRDGHLHPRFIAKSPDGFVINGGFVRHKTRYKPDSKSSPLPSLAGKISLGDILDG